MRKIIALLLVVVLTATAAVGATLAYLTDRDAEANVFTIGNVDIELTETFGQGAKLLPGKDITKEPKITNTGKNDAWVWATIAIPSALDVADDASQNVIHFNYSKESVANGLWTWKNGDDPWMMEIVENDDVVYNVYTVLYQTALKPGDTTAEPVMTKVYMDHHVDIDPNGDLYHVDKGVANKLNWNIKTNGNPVMYVAAYAVQTEGFNSVQEAFEAYKGQWSNNDNSWMAWGKTEASGSNGDVEFEAAPEDAVKVDGADKASVLAAIESAEPGAVIALTEDTTIAGYNAGQKLVIDKNITLNLNGKTLTTESGWGGIDLKGGASIVNGTINHTGNTAAIKAFQVGAIENVVINVTETAGKVKGGIVVQEGAGCYIGSIKNVVINGATNGIETYRCGDRDDYAIGSMENVTINALDTGIQLSAPIGTLTDCSIKGANIGINAYLYGPYYVSANLVNCKVEGATDIYAHDEVGKTNPGSMNLTYDSTMSLNCTVVQEFESEVVGRVFVGIK